MSLALTIPVLLWSRDPQAWLGYAAPRFPGSDWIPAILGTAVFLYGGLVFLRGAAGELRGRQPGMMTLISMAIMVAFSRLETLIIMLAGSPASLIIRVGMPYSVITLAYSFIRRSS